MFCVKCGNELEDDMIFCNKCGNKVGKIKNNIKKEENIKEENESIQKETESRNEYTSAVKINIPKTKTIITGILITAVTYFGFMGFWYLVNGEFYVPAFIKVLLFGVGIFYIILGWGEQRYQGKCPYCDSNLIIYEKAVNCPICQKRIMVKDDKFYKV